METPWTFFGDEFPAFMMWPCNARCVTWALPTFQNDDSSSCSIFLDRPAGQASGRETSRASSTISSWLAGIPPYRWHWKLLWYPKCFKEVFGSAYEMPAMVWQHGLCSLYALPSMGGAETCGTADALVDPLLVSPKSLSTSHLTKAESWALDCTGSGLPTLLECAATN